MHYLYNILTILGYLKVKRCRKKKQFSTQLYTTEYVTWPNEAKTQQLYFDGSKFIVSYQCSNAAISRTVTNSKSGHTGCVSSACVWQNVLIFIAVYVNRLQQTHCWSKSHFSDAWFSAKTDLKTICRLSYGHHASI